MNTFDIMRKLISEEPDFLPNTTEPEAGRFLCSLCGMVQATRVLEVGTWKGYTALWLAEAVGIGNVWMIDKEDNLSRHFPEQGRKNFIKGTSWEEILKLGEQFDLVYLDADHQYKSTLMELEALAGMKNPPKLICCHDSIACPGVKEAIKMFAFEQFASSVVSYLHVTLQTPRGQGLSIIQLS